jgi:hypothetical protein
VGRRTRVISSDHGTDTRNRRYVASIARIIRQIPAL